MLNFSVFPTENCTTVAAGCDAIKWNCTDLLFIVECCINSKKSREKQENAQICGFVQGFGPMITKKFRVEQKFSTTLWK